MLYEVITLAVRYHPRYANPLGYDSTSRELPVSPSFGYKTDRWAPWHVGVGMYGALGFTYNHDADTASVITSYSIHYTKLYDIISQVLL